MKTIFTVTQIEMSPKEPLPWSHKNTCAWFQKMSDAIDLVEDENMDLNETIYDYIVIEEYLEGWPARLKSSSRTKGGRKEFNEYWYRWNKKESKYIPCEKPKELAQVICFGI